MHVGTHGPCVRSKGYMHSLQQPRCLLVILLARTHGLRLLEGAIATKNAHGLWEAGRVVMEFGVRSGRLWLVGPRAWTARTLVRWALCAHLAQVTAQFLREFCHE